MGQPKKAILDRRCQARKELKRDHGADNGLIGECASGVVGIDAWEPAPAISMDVVEMGPLVSDAQTGIGRRIRKWDKPCKVIQRVEHWAVLDFVATGGGRKAEVPSLGEAVVAVVALEFQANSVAESVPDRADDSRSDAGPQAGAGRCALPVHQMLIHENVGACANAYIEPGNWRRVRRLRVGGYGGGNECRGKTGCF